MMGVLYKSVAIIIIIMDTFMIRKAHCQWYKLATSTCKIPDYAVVYFDDNHSRPRCGDKLIFVKRLSADRVQISMKTQFYACCYRFVIRDDLEHMENNDVRYSACTFLKNTTVVPLHGDFMNILCTSDGVEVVYEDFFAFTQQLKKPPKIVTDKKPENVTDNKSKNVTDKKGKNIADKKNIATDKKPIKLAPPYNVLMIGMPFMSRTRAYYSLRETANYFYKKNFLDFRGFNKIAQDSDLNLLATLSGRDDPFSASEECADMSYCNHYILWHEFEKRGYVTAFGEDSLYKKGVFYGQKGFSVPPVHHYMRPFFLAAEAKIGPSLCSRKVTSALQILDYINDFSRTYPHRKHFGFFWINSFSEEINQSPKFFDKTLLNFFRNLEKSDSYKNTFIIFFSNSGVQTGPVKIRAESYHDERLPMLFMRVPESFKQSHKYVDLFLNQYRLTSPFDLYLTVWDILKISTGEMYYPRTKSCLKCTSLLKSIPESRTCLDAGIPDLMCTCHNFDIPLLNQYGAIYSLTKSVAYLHDLSMNIRTIPCTICAPFTVSSLVRLNHYTFDQITQYYVLVVIANPDNLIFEITTMRSLDNNGNYVYEVIDLHLITPVNFIEKCAVKRKFDNFCVCQNVPNCTYGFV